MRRVTRDDLPEVLKDKRGRQTQSEFAHDYGVTKQAVSAWESGDYIPNSEILAQLNIRVVYEVGK